MENNIMVAKWVIELEKKPDVAIGVIQSSMTNYEELCNKIDDPHLATVIRARLEELIEKIESKYGRN